MDHVFTHKPSADLIYRTKLTHGVSNGSDFSVPQVVLWYDFESLVDNNPNLRQSWRDVLGPKWKIKRIGHESLEDSIFAEKLVDAGRFRLAELYLAMFHCSRKSTHGWVLDKNLHLHASLDQFVQQKYDVHTFFFAQQSALSDWRYQIGLHVFCINYNHWLLPIFIEAFKSHYRKNPDLPDEYFTVRLWNGLLNYVGLQLEHDVDPVVNSYMKIHPYHYAPNCALSPPIPSQYDVRKFASI